MAQRHVYDLHCIVHMNHDSTSMDQEHRALVVEARGGGVLQHIEDASWRVDN